MPAPHTPRRPPRSRWTSFVADRSGDRALHEEGNPAHRVRVEHNRDTILVHLSGEDGQGWMVLAVDRATRRAAVGESRRQLDAAREAFDRLYPPDDFEPRG
jgi:hypothetical protein